MAKTFGNKGKVGTPRGYANKADIERVDKAMEPVAEVGKQLPYFIPGGGEILAGGKAAAKVVEAGAKLLPKLTRGAKATEKAVGAGTKALEYKPAVAMEKVAEKVAAPLNRGAQRLQAKLGKMREAGAKARNVFRKDTGTFGDKVASTRTRPRTPKESEKFGPLVKRGDNLPAKQGSRAVTPYKEPGKAVTKYQAGARGLATIGKVGDKGSGSRLGTWLKRGAAGAAVLGAGAGLYKGADNTKASKTDKGGTVGGGMSYTGPGVSAKGDKASTFKAKRQGMNVPGSPTNPKKTTTKSSGTTSGDKSRLNKGPKKPLSNFERMKMRQYEKEGIGGRSVTSSGAKSRVMKERSFKFKDLFK